MSHDTLYYLNFEVSKGGVVQGLGGIRDVAKQFYVERCNAPPQLLKVFLIVRLKTNSSRKKITIWKSLFWLWWLLLERGCDCLCYRLVDGFAVLVGVSVWSVSMGFEGRRQRCFGF